MDLLNSLRGVVGKRSGSRGVIRLVIADDEPQVRRALRRLLDRDDRFEVVAEASDGAEAIRHAETSQPDVVVIDLAMPETDGLTAIPRIVKVAPNAKIIVLSSMASLDDTSARATELGARLVLDKYTPPKALLKAIVSAAAG